VVFGGPSAYEQPIPDRHRRQAINAQLTSDQAEIASGEARYPKTFQKSIPFCPPAFKPAD
jgi:hypothetical protein